MSPLDLPNSLKAVTPNEVIFKASTPASDPKRGNAVLDIPSPNAPASPFTIWVPSSDPSTDGFTSSNNFCDTELPISTIGLKKAEPKDAEASVAVVFIDCNVADKDLFSSSFFFLASSVAELEMLNELAYTLLELERSLIKALSWLI